MRLKSRQAVSGVACLAYMHGAAFSMEIVLSESVCLLEAGCVRQDALCFCTSDGSRFARHVVLPRSLTRGKR